MAEQDHNQDNSSEYQELFEHHRIVADPGQKLLRIDKFLVNRIENASRNKIQNAAKAGNILVNDQEVKPNHKIHPGDVVSVMLSHPPREIEIIPQKIPIDIVYEDKDILLVNKAAGMVVHPAYANFDGTLLNALAWHIQNRSATPNEEGQAYLVHRIDKDTSGLILSAKNELAQSRLGKQFFNHSVEREYQALVWGDLKEQTGTIEGHIGRDPRDRKRMTVFPGGEQGKEAVTHFEVIQSFGYVTRIKCRLETGRTHQIRVHMKYLKHPLFNDATYGGDKILKGTTFTKYRQFINNCLKMLPRQALHAKSLGFMHPLSGKKMFFDSNLPEDMQGVIDKWEHYTRHVGDGSD